MEPVGHANCSSLLNNNLSSDQKLLTKSIGQSNIGAKMKLNPPS